MFRHEERAGIPICKRNWLRVYRRSQGYKSIQSLTTLIGYKYNTYGALEGGSSYNTKNMTKPTLVQIADRMGIPLKLFYYPCDENGLIYQEEAVKDFIIFFRTHGFPNIATSPLLEHLFTPDLIEHITEVYAHYRPNLIRGIRL